MPLRRLSETTRERALLVWIVVFTALTFYAIRENRELGNDGRQAQEALCVLRVDLDRRVELSRQFLEDNPGGIPGIPASTLRSSIANQEATIEALSALDCPVTTP